MLHAQVCKAVIEQGTWAQDDAATAKFTIHNHQHHGIHIADGDFLAAAHLNLNIETF